MRSPPYVEECEPLVHMTSDGRSIMQRLVREDTSKAFLQIRSA